MDEWAVQQRVPPPSRLPGVSTLAWRFPTSGGGLLLLPESRQAQFEGCKYWLGYAPVPTNQTLLVHSTDAAKNISPLLQPFRLPPTGQRVIVIDPGHGGSNTGTRTETGILEKDLTLDWAMRTGLLLARHGWRVYLTRTNDIELSLEDRVIIADKAQASLFLSLHFNSVHPQTQQQGIETFCTTPVGLPSTLVRDGTDEPDRFYPNNAFDSENLRYAVRLHSSLVRKTGAVDRGVRRARFMGVIRSQRRPAVLLEAGFLSNPGEARLLATPAYRQQLAEAVVEALVDSTRLAALPVPPRNLP